MYSGQKRAGGLAFVKMQALGNDFVIIDRRSVDHCTRISGEMARTVADRRLGVGCDQIAILHDDDKSNFDNRVDVAIEFLNADGSVAGACGNATRCIGRLIMEETGQDSIRIRTARGILVAKTAQSGHVAVNMGKPQLKWTEIPLSRSADLLELPLEGSPVAIGMGNPHCVFFVDDVSGTDPAVRGPSIERHPLFPERTNVEFVQVLDRQNIRVRIWERGTGVTPASGSGSCASAVAARLRGLTGRQVTVHLDGGTLDIDWQDDGIWMTGPAHLVYVGTLVPGFPEITS